MTLPSSSSNASSKRVVRSRFAPSPTGMLHLGGARTALYAWALARRDGGQFVLRIEDTDVERSTPEKVESIIDAMNWLGLDVDEGPYFQMQRIERYREVIARMIDEGTAYRCWCTPEQLDAMRDAQRERGEKPRYDGTWRPEPGKTLPSVPADAASVVRFRNPRDGAVTWNDFVKGSITIANDELDDLVIARSDGTPTYNFCVVVDDMDMRITHVIRGDDHVNNTPRQINILQALKAEVPAYGHVPMILGPDGQKLSKRHGAVSVMQYEADGFLPEAMLNYLARLGWSHGDEEVFGVEQFVQWFDVEHLSKSAAQWDPAKLRWVNQHHIREADPERLARLVQPRIEARGGRMNGVPLTQAIALLRDRAETLDGLADAAMLFYDGDAPSAELLAQHVTSVSTSALRDFVERIGAIEWNKEGIAAALKATLAQHGLKMPQLAVPLRVLVTGRAQTPSVDAVLALFDRDEAIRRIQRGLDGSPSQARGL